MQPLMEGINEYENRQFILKYYRIRFIFIFFTTDSDFRAAPILLPHIFKEKVQERSH